VWPIVAACCVCTWLFSSVVGGNSLRERAMVKETGTQPMGIELVSRVRKWREVQTLQHDSLPNVPETLERIRKFLQEHETPSSNDNTHAVFDNYVDWWASSKPSGKLAMAEDNTLDLLYKYISQMWMLGVPLSLAEKRSPEIKFIQDITIWGTGEKALSVNELMNPDCAFAKLLGQCLGEVYPKSKFLDVVIFDATGMAKKKGIQKTSVRLVWGGIFVDKDRSIRIHDYVIAKFRESVDQELKELSEQAQELNKDNIWNDIFNIECYQGRNAVRMPLCDRVSPLPMQQPEHRPFVPVGVNRFNYKDGAMSVERVVGPDDLDYHDWVKIGSIRCPAGTSLTEWTQPVWKGQVQRTFGATPQTQLGDRRSGQVRVRTRFGSDTVGGPARRGPRNGAAPVREQEKTTTVEREFDGTLQDFRGHLLTQLGNGAEETENLKVDEIAQELEWKSSDNQGASVLFKASNRKVYVTGMPYQVRNLTQVISSFVRPVGGYANSTTATQRSRGPTSNAGYSDNHSLAPSLVYAPSQVPASLAPSQAFSTFSSGGRSDSGAGRPFQPSVRIVGRNFDPQSENELKLIEGDRITVTHDPENGSRNVHRWVYGTNNNTQDKGWFPLSHAGTVENEDATAPS